MYFCYFVIISLEKGCGPSFEQIWIPFKRRATPLEKGLALHLNEFEFPSQKDALCQVWLKLAQRFWKKDFLTTF